MRRLPKLAAALFIVTAVTVTATLADGRRADSATTVADPDRPAVAPTQGTWVTLVTGDRVMSSTLAVDPAPRSRPVGFQQMIRNGDDYVVPEDAAALLQAGKLDWQLFNISGLVRQEYDDAHSTDLPLLVRYDREQRSMRSTASLAGASVEQVMPAVKMASLEAKKAGAARLWKQLRPSQGLSFAGGIGKVWLNAKVKASLDVSVPQIGAPAAWAKGLTGAGVTVAVLDTGVDTDHPDLTSRIGASQDFSGKGTVEDGNGHGTHVASTVAGTGAASGGKYRGVAPDASLAIGKVLDDSGNGTAESVIAGMQWAATQADAKVVNLSLGGAPSGGTDPLSAAVDTLSREHGTLFVAAAGNDGEDENVAAPAAADEALAVGSVSRDDALSAFSNRGPRLGDSAVKPELVAPGEGIVAARPADVPPLGEPVDAAYQRLDGTSMATPHVTGSAALIAQQHPSWTGAQVKAALMSTAAAVADASVYTVGTGRVDVGKATAQSVTATGSVSVDLPWPNQGARGTRTISWRNTSSTPASLTLDLALTDQDDAAAPAGLATLSATTVTIPANGSAAIEIAIAAQDGKPGRYSGVITSQGDGISTRTAVSIAQEEEKYDLTVALTDRDGKPQGPHGLLPTVFVQSLDDPELGYWGPPGEIRLPKGRYGVHASIQTPRAGQEPSYSFISAPELLLESDRSVRLDARLGRPMSITPPDPAAADGVHRILRLTKFSSCECDRGYFVEIDPRFNPAYAATLPGIESDSFALAQFRQASEPVLGLTVSGRDGFGVKVWGFENTPTPNSGGAVQAVYGGEGTAQDLAKIDARGKLVLIELANGTTYGEVFQRTAAIKAAGAILAMVVVKTGASLASGTSDPEESAPALPTLDGNSVTGRRFAALVKAGPVKASYVINRQPSLRYELAYGVERAVTTAQVYRPRKQDLAAVRTSYHDNASSIRQVHALSHLFGSANGIVDSQPVTAPQIRTEYFTPGSWTLSASGLSTTVDLSAGQTAIAWNKAVVGPTFRGTTTGAKGEGDRAWARRKNGAIDVILPMFGDSAGRPQVPLPIGGTDTGSIELRREGQLVETVEEPDAAQIPVPDEAATYQLTAEATRTATWWPLSTKVAASWTFRSSAEQEGAALPLLTVRFDPAVDVRNRTPGGAFKIPVYVERQEDEHPKVTSLAVEVSYDDGAHWQAAPVSRTDDHWTIALQQPKAGFVSLRAKAVDDGGNTVNQTVIRGYEIGGKKR